MVSCCQQEPEQFDVSLDGVRVTSSGPLAGGAVSGGGMTDVRLTGFICCHDADCLISISNVDGSVTLHSTGMYVISLKKHNKMMC